MTSRTQVAKIVEALHAAGIPALASHSEDVSQWDHEIVITRRVHVKVGAFDGRANVLLESADGETWTLYETHKASRVARIVDDVNNALSRLA